MANKSTAALAPSGSRGWLDFDPFRDFEERMRQFFGMGLAPFGRLGYECGLTIGRFSDYKVGDVIEAFVNEKVAPTQL